MKNTKVYNMTVIAMMAAIMCIVAPSLNISIPISPVPLTLAFFVIYITAYVLRPVPATACIGLYLLLGLAGLPVFSGFSGGLQKLAGPTGGYLIGYLFMAWICAFFIWKWSDKVYMHIVGMILGSLAAYAFGTIWFCISRNVGFLAALGVCVIPYLFGDAIKIAMAAAAGPLIRRKLIKSGFIEIEL